VTDEQYPLRSVRSRGEKRFRPFVIGVHETAIERSKQHREGVAPFATGVWLFVEPQGTHVVFTGASVCRLLDLPEA